MTRIQFIESHGWNKISHNGRCAWLAMDCGDFTDIIRINDVLSLNWEQVRTLIGSGIYNYAR